jgi:hypothetical protein
MTMTRPCRRMIRHLLQIFLTLGLTFTVLSLRNLIRAVGVLWVLKGCYLYRYTIRPRLRS